MTHIRLDATDLPYRITHIDGRPPSRVREFLGRHSFLIHQEDEQTLVSGVGRPDKAGTGVRFYQNDPAHGRLSRVWHLRTLPDNLCVAEQDARTEANWSPTK